MISIDIEFLTGRYIATSYNDRNRAEWPPEPARLFSACVATLHEFQDLGEQARAALKWLEAQDAPYIVASPAERRTNSSIYVPVNDPQLCNGWEKEFAQLQKAKSAVESSEPGKQRIKSEKSLAAKTKGFSEAVDKAMISPGKSFKKDLKTAKSMLPGGRNRQPRKFPSVTPWNPVVSFVWPEAKPEEEICKGLGRLLSCLVRFGHSSSLVRASLGEGALLEARVSDVWTPDHSGQDATMRVFEEGQIDKLERAHQVHQGTKPRIMPCAYQNYRYGKSGSTWSREQSVFGEDWVIFRFVPEPNRRRPVRMSLTNCVALTRALRATLMSNAPPEALEALSGHNSDGSPLRANHVAFVPLADIAGQWAHGSVLGLAVVLPRSLDEETRAGVFRAIGSLEAKAGGAGFSPKLKMGRVGEVSIQRLREQERRTTLRARTWCAPSQRWATVTPIAMDRHPGSLNARRPEVAQEAERKAEEIIAGSCARIGLPRPVGVQVMRRSIFDAAPDSQSYPSYPFKRAPRRLFLHAEIHFDRAVHGPVIVGAGRYFGLGLCRGLT